MDIDELKERYADFYVPRFRVDVGGRVFREDDGVLSELTVDTTVDGADRFSARVNYPFDPETETFEGMEKGRFQPGTPVEIWVGYGNALGPETAESKSRGDPFDSTFLGTITTMRPEFPSSGGPTITISGFDPLHDMTKGTEDRSWNDTPFSTVVDEVTAPYGFKDRKIQTVSLKPRKLIQDAESDLTFLRRFAEEHGFELFTRRGVLHFRERDPTKTPRDPSVTLRYGESLASFSPEVNEAEQVESVEVRDWDPTTRSEIVGVAKRSDDGGGSGTRVFRVAVESEADAETIAKSYLERISSARVRGNGETLGLPEIVAGETIRLEGMGYAFTTNYHVNSATHTVGSSGYRTTVDVAERPI